jgi:hypothetical protein
MQTTIRELLRYPLLLSGLFSVHFCMSQENRQVYEIGLNAGRMIYQGDLTPSALGSFQTSRLSIGLTFAKPISTSLAIRAALLFGGISGDEAIYSKPAYRQQRNFNFTSSVREITVQAVWSFPGVPQQQKGFSAYAFAGGGFSLLRVVPNSDNFNPEFFGADAARIQSGLAEDAAHGTPKLLPLLLAGAGVKYFFKPQWGVNAEASYRITYTDYLDGFSRSANPDLNDHYMNYSIGVIYRTGRTGTALDCPKVAY